MNVITFCRYIFIGLERKQVIKKSQTVEIKVILIFFGFLMEGCKSVQIITDPGAQKTYGSGTLKERLSH
jgi:hypothetical protein